MHGVTRHELDKAQEGAYIRDDPCLGFCESSWAQVADSKFIDL